MYKIVDTFRGQFFLWWDGRGSNVLSCVHSKWAMVFLFLICMEGERLPERVERGGLSGEGAVVDGRTFRQAESLMEL